LAKSRKERLFCETNQPEAEKGIRMKTVAALKLNFTTFPLGKDKNTCKSLYV